MEASNIIVEIVKGTFDESLDDLNYYIRERQNVLNVGKLLRIKVGDTVMFNDNTNPQYLRGLLATVTKVNRKTVVVDLIDGPVGRYGRSGIRTPLALVDLVKS